METEVGDGVDVNITPGVDNPAELSVKKAYRLKERSEDKNEVAIVKGV